MKCFCLLLIMLYTFCYSLNCHPTCQTRLSESILLSSETKDDCTSCDSSSTLNVASNTNEMPTNNIDTINTKGRLLAAGSNSSGWAVIVIIVAVIAMVGYFVLLGYMIMTWNSGSTSKAEEPKPASSPNADIEMREPNPIVEMGNEGKMDDIENVENPEPEIDYS